jgi:hypothetical protein
MHHTGGGGSRGGRGSSNNNSNNNNPSPTGATTSPGRFIASVTHRLSQPNNNAPSDHSDDSPTNAQGRFAVDSPDYLRQKLFKATKQVFMLEQMVMLLKKSKDKAVASPVKEDQDASVRADSIFHQKERLEEMVRKLTTDNQSLESQLGEATREKENLQAAMSGSEGDKAELQQQILDMSSSETVLLKKLELATDECEQLRVDKSELQDGAKTAGEEMERGKKRISELQAQLEIFTNDNEKMRQQTEKMRQELSVVQTQLALATAVPSPESAHASNTDLLTEFYTAHDPSRVEKVDQILKLYAIPELTDALMGKYGEAPTFVDPLSVSSTELSEAMLSQALETSREEVEAGAEAKIAQAEAQADARITEAITEANEANEDQHRLITLLEEHVATLKKENEDVLNLNEDLQSKLSISLRRQKEAKHSEEQALEREKELELKLASGGGGPLQAATPPAVDNAAVLLEFYQTHDPSKASPEHVKELLQKFELVELMNALRAKYGEAPALETVALPQAVTPPAVDNAELLVEFYSKYDEAKANIENAKALIEQYGAQQLMDALRAKYGEAPAFELAAPPQAATPPAVDNAAVLLEFYQTHDPSKASPEHVKELLQKFELPQLKNALRAKYGEAPSLSLQEAPKEKVPADSSPWYANKMLLAAVFAGSMVLSGLGGHQLGQPVCPTALDPALAGRVAGAEGTDCEQRFGVLQTDFAALEKRLEDLPAEDTEKLVAKIAQVQAESNLSLPADDAIVIDVADAASTAASASADVRLLQLEEMHQGALAAKEQEHEAAMKAKEEELAAALEEAQAAKGGDAAEGEQGNTKALMAKVEEYKATLAVKGRQHAAALKVHEGRLLTQNVNAEHWARLQKTSTEALASGAPAADAAAAPEAGGDSEAAVSAAIAAVEERHEAAMKAKEEQFAAALEEAQAAKGGDAAEGEQGKGGATVDTEAAVAAAVAVAEGKHAAALAAKEEEHSLASLAKEEEHAAEVKRTKEEMSASAASDLEDAADLVKESTDSAKAAYETADLANTQKDAAHAAALKAKQAECDASFESLKKESQEECVASMETKQEEYAALLTAKEELDAQFRRKDKDHAGALSAKETELAAALRAQAAASHRDPEEGDSGESDCDHIPMSVMSGVAGLGVGLAVMLATGGSLRSKEGAAGGEKEAKPVFTERNGKLLVEFYAKHDASKANIEQAKALLSKYTVAQLKQALEAKYGIAPALEEAAPTTPAAAKHEQMGVAASAELEARAREMKQVFEKKAAVQAAAMQKMAVDHARAIQKMGSSRGGEASLKGAVLQPTQDERGGEVAVLSSPLLPGCLQLALQLRQYESRSARRAWCRWMQQSKGVGPLLARCFGIYNRITRVQIMRAFLRLNQHANTFVYLQSISTPVKRKLRQEAEDDYQAQLGQRLEARFNGASPSKASAMVLAAENKRASVLRRAFSGVQSRDKFTTQQGFGRWRLTAVQIAAQSNTQKLSGLLQESEKVGQEAALTLQQLELDSELLEAAKERGLPARLHEQRAIMRVHSVLRRVRDNNISEAWGSWKVCIRACIAHRLSRTRCSDLTPLLRNHRTTLCVTSPLVALGRSRSVCRRSA